MRSSTKVVPAAALTLLIACGNDAPQEADAPTAEVPDETVANFTTEESDSGQVRWKLRAPMANRYNDRGEFLMEKPKIEFYDEFGNLQTTLTSEHGQYMESTSDLIAYGDVVVVSVQGDILETDTLRYLNGVDKIVSDSFVKLTRGNDVVTGYGLECDHTLSSVDIKRNVEATILDDEGNFDE